MNSVLELDKIQHSSGKICSEHIIDIQVSLQCLILISSYQKDDKTQIRQGCLAAMIYLFIYLFACGLITTDLYVRNTPLEAKGRKPNSVGDVERSALEAKALKCSLLGWKTAFRFVINLQVALYINS